MRLPRRTVAVATHRGPHDDLDLTYAAIGSFTARHGLRARDLVEETYLVGPRDTDDPDRWRTLVAWLVTPSDQGDASRDREPFGPSERFQERTSGRTRE
ncbi:GyrI-like domain-containing protein [Streptomyces sp. NPDC101776]|uniref:GyrI-like domain-containing protein n=1 Tax=Streptomyces sp. NPDC101776 TaxID=3366146 RepID=UPI0038136072